jgi:hypothetical protein
VHEDGGTLADVNRDMPKWRRDIRLFAGVNVKDIVCVEVTPANFPTAWEVAYRACELWYNRSCNSKLTVNNGDVRSQDRCDENIMANKVLSIDNKELRLLRERPE